VSEFVCPQCGHSAEAPTKLEDAVFRCTQCGQRVAFAQPIPRIVFSKLKDPRFVRLLVDDSIPGRESRFHLQLDVFYARELAQHILDTTEVPTNKVQIPVDVEAAAPVAGTPTLRPDGE
jgi:DNA-directed RNA polymerase subunit RPC12/RpoP